MKRLIIFLAVSGLFLFSGFLSASFAADPAATNNGQNAQSASSEPSAPTTTDAAGSNAPADQQAASSSGSGQPAAPATPDAGNDQQGTEAPAAGADDSQPAGSSDSPSQSSAPTAPSQAQPAADTDATPIRPSSAPQSDSLRAFSARQHLEASPDSKDAAQGSRTTADGNISQQVSSCMDLSKNDGASMQDLQQQLLQQLRRSAVDVLFGKVYYQQKTGLDKQNYASSYVKQVAQQLEFQTEPEFYNGNQFGELCVRAWVSMPSQRVPTISPRLVRLDNFCYQADPGQSRQTLRKLATTAAVDRVLENIAPGTLVPIQYRQQIEDGATINGDIRKLDERTYCLSISVNVIPLQVDMLSGKEEKARKAPAISEPKPGFSLDLKQFKEGDLTPDFGKDVAVFQDIEGKSLGSNVHQGATAVVNLNSHKNFKALVYVKKDIPYDFLHSEDLLLFTLHYKNGKYEPYAFNLTMGDNNQPMAYFRSWSYSTDVFPWANAANFNEYKVERKDGLAVFFYNGKFMFNFPSEGDELVQIKVPLRWNDRFYNVVIYDEDPNPGETKQ